MKHLVFFSGGAGSWMTAKTLFDNNDKESVHLLFTDTLIEDKTLYKLLLQSAELFYKVDMQEEIEASKAIQELYESESGRKKQIQEIRDSVCKKCPNFIWIDINKTPWEIFESDKMIGNSRLARCSHLIKQDLARDIVESKFDPADTILYLGIGWDEVHRAKAPKRNWSPYQVKFPLTKRPYYTNQDIFREMESVDIDVPELYQLGFSHNNCGGFCVRAGQAHFINLLKQKPKLYDYHEKRESDLIEQIGKDVSIMKRQVNNEIETLTMRDLRIEHETSGDKNFDLFDFGGCGCFVDDLSAN